MKVYLDSSVLLRIALRDGPLLPGWNALEAPYSSRLTFVELRRVLDRLRLTGELQAADAASVWADARRLERTIQILPLTDDVLDGAGQPMPSPVGTLDAIHLASALLVREREAPDLAFATHDRQQAIAATLFGFEVIGVDI